MYIVLQIKIIYTYITHITYYKQKYTNTKLYNYTQNDEYIQITFTNIHKYKVTPEHRW